MPRKCYTAQDVKNLADQKVFELRLQKGDLITPLARDQARESGVCIIEPETAPSPQPGATLISPQPAAGGLEAQVRQIVAKLLEKESIPAAAPPPSVVPVEGVGLIRPIVTEAQLRDQIRRPQKGMRVRLPANARLSPSAQDFLKEWNIEVILEDAPDGAAAADEPGARPS